MSTGNNFNSSPSRTIGVTKSRYRMLADGTVIDQTTGKTVGYISSQSDIARIWSLGGMAKQKHIREILGV